MEQFLKDFCLDEASPNDHNKLKYVMYLWKQVRESTGPKIYSPILRVYYQEELVKIKMSKK